MAELQIKRQRGEIIDERIHQPFINISSPEGRHNLHESLYLIEDIRRQWLILKGSDPRASHHLFQGIPNKIQTILLHYYTNLPRRWLSYRSEYIKYPPDNAETGKKFAMITSISIIDGRKDGTGGKAKIVSGGVGSRKVTIKLTSKLFKGYEFTVIITGYYENDGDGEAISFHKKYGTNSVD